MSNKDCPVCGFKGGRTRGDIVLTLQGEINHLRAERDALLDLRDAAQDARTVIEDLPVGPGASKLMTLLDALDAPQPTEGARP